MSSKEQNRGGLGSTDNHTGDLQIPPLLEDYPCLTVPAHSSFFAFSGICSNTTQSLKLSSFACSKSSHPPPTALEWAGAHKCEETMGPSGPSWALWGCKACLDFLLLPDAYLPPGSLGPEGVWVVGSVAGEEGKRLN